MDFRIGQGIDFHRLEDGLDLWLGGIKITSDKGAVAHSDGDVLIHAICDAILGAAGLKDIGHYFPDTDEKFRGIDSRKILAETIRLTGDKGYSIVNIDSTVCLEQPKIAPWIDSMKEALSQVTDLDTDKIGIKATTTEKMGFTGRREGVAAYATVLLSKV